MKGSRKLGIAVLLLLTFLFSSHALGAEKTIGVILTGDIPFYKDIHKAFSEELASRGIKVQVLVQTPSPEIVSWLNAVRKLVATDVDVIVTYGGPVTAAALSETSGIPIVYAGVFDPEGLGIAGKKNATGVSSRVPLIGIVKILKDIKDFGKLGIVYNDAEKDTIKQAAEIEGLSGKFAFQPVKFNIKKYGDVARIKDIDALFITTSCVAHQCTDNIIGVSRNLGIPTATAMSGGQDKGVILTISADPKEQGREAAEILALIVSGQTPSSIPLRMPEKVDMIINLKEATAIGLKVPFDVMTSATKVIE